MDTNLLVNMLAFMLLTLLWLGFGAALVFNRELLNETWRLFRSLPLLIQLVVGVLALPVVVGLWVWHTSWPAWLRLAVLIGLAWVTLYTFFPRLPLA